MIRVNNVVKTFGDFRALDGVNLHVRDGAIYGLVGPVSYTHLTLPTICSV